MTRAAITIFDTDGGNPYGREVASLLQGAGYDVDAILPADTRWIPDGLTARKFLPANGRAGRVAQIARQFGGLWRALLATWVRRRILVVIMTRSWYDQFALGILAHCGARLVVVAHDPVPKVPLPFLQAKARRFFWRSAAMRVAHSPQMAAETLAACGRAAAVVPHLPFTRYAAWTHTVAPAQPPSEKLRLLILGQMRADKGLEHLPAIFSAIPEAQRRQLSLSFAGRGAIADIETQLAKLITVARPASATRLDDEDIAHALAQNDVLLAPYPLVSASGSVVLALCRGLGVIAYDSGAIGDVLAPSGLVPAGNQQAFAARIVAAFGDGGGGPRVAMEDWRRASLEAWAAAVDAAAG